jgi:hypothetical protein
MALRHGMETRKLVLLRNLHALEYEVRILSLF